MAAILLAIEIAFSFVWPYNSYSLTAEVQLANRIEAEHHRVCNVYLYSDSGLKLAARWRARDMIVRNYYSHIILGTHNYVWDYFYRWHIRWSMAGEDITWNAYPVSLAARGAFDQFMGSPSHRALIQWCGYRRFGVGAYQGEGNKKMFVVEVVR